MTKDETIAALAARLRNTAERLDKMIRNTLVGGGSTENVDAMRAERDAIYALLGRLGL